jgi:hypothetical protein
MEYVQSYEEFAKLLQILISPMILISGVGLLLLSITNRIARPIDRIRMIIKELPRMGAEEQQINRRELKVFYKRARILQASIASVACSMLASAMIIILLFLMYLFGIQLEIGVFLCFIFSILFLLASVLFFLWDISLSLKALGYEVDRIAE